MSDAVAHESYFGPPIRLPEMIEPTFQGELMLAGWAETHNGGAKVTFWLPDTTDLDTFRGLTVKKGNTAGQRFMAVLVEIGDDEQPKVHTSGSGLPKQRPQNLEPPSQRRLIMGTHRMVNRLPRAKQEQLVDYITRALAQGRLRGLSDQEVANVAAHALGFAVTKGNVKGVRLELALHKHQGSTTIVSEGIVPLTSCDRHTRVAAMNWLQLLGEAELLEESIVDVWGKVTYSPGSRRLSLETSHGALSTKVKEPAL